jgi:hypothetical protein
MLEVLLGFVSMTDNYWEGSSEATAGRCALSGSWRQGIPSRG